MTIGRDRAEKQNGSLKLQWPSRSLCTQKNVQCKKKKLKMPVSNFSLES